MSFTTLYETTKSYTLSLIQSILTESGIEHRIVEHGVSPVALGMPAGADLGTSVMRILVDEERLAEAKQILCEHDIVCDVSERLRLRCFESIALPLLTGRSDDMERLVNYLRANNKATVAAILADIHGHKRGPELLKRLFVRLLVGGGDGDEDSDGGGDETLTLNRLARFINDFPLDGFEETLRLLAARREPDVRRTLAEALALLPSIRPEAILVELLGDGDAVVREAAIESLFSLTAEDFGYEPDADPADRDAAVEQWEAWLAKHR